MCISVCWTCQVLAIGMCCLCIKRNKYINAISMFHMFTKTPFLLYRDWKCCLPVFFFFFLPHGLNIQQRMFPTLDLFGPGSNMLIVINWHIEHVVGHVFSACLRMFYIPIATNWHIRSAWKINEHPLVIGKFGLCKRKNEKMKNEKKTKPGVKPCVSQRDPL